MYFRYPDDALCHMASALLEARRYRQRQLPDPDFDLIFKMIFLIF
jgi:hypothetical protein